MTARTALFAYDIHENRLRRHSLRTLREWRLDGQLSVRECLLEPGQAQILFGQLQSELDATSDDLLFAWVQHQRSILTRGKGRAALTPGLILAA
ncbi:MAG: CRISPR-associated endonuclease Cas2 [Gammaproteobacteria bacterium]|jgi:CRISPR/Cas system-associated endoribonuclease Cas2|nr:CRISPR-associated endonuclease Cas2 [Gammaproteobacteria bacterium]